MRCWCHFHLDRKVVEGADRFWRAEVGNPLVRTGQLYAVLHRTGDFACFVAGRKLMRLRVHPQDLFFFFFCVSCTKLLPFSVNQSTINTYSKEQKQETSSRKNILERVGFLWSVEMVSSSSKSLLGSKMREKCCERKLDVLSGKRKRKSCTVKNSNKNEQQVFFFDIFSFCPLSAARGSHTPKTTGNQSAAPQTAHSATNA